jgi:glycosyltransferase involved in cell wall biosynthesis
LYARAAVFVCPSIYEPFGIINLEAMACSTPVVASKVGGIPEIITHGQTGYLVPLTTNAAATAPLDPQAFARDLAQAVNRVLEDPKRAQQMGMLAREQVLKRFSWQAIARQTRNWYEKLCRRGPGLE